MSERKRYKSVHEMVRDLSDKEFVDRFESDMIKSRWSKYICPCTNCDYIGPLDAFTHGECYDPCPCCGHEKEQGKTGRFWYHKHEYLTFLPKWLRPYKKVFSHVEWLIYERND